MNNYWVRFGCFLTGYNYDLVKNSSEASVKAVKKYLSALIIIGIIWGFIGFVFTERYLHGNWKQSVFGGLLMIIVVIQIERQIILSVGKRWGAIIFRVIIGFVMAILGSIILDQIIYKDDIEIAKVDFVQEEVDRVLPKRTAEIKEQVWNLDSLITLKEFERNQVIEEVTSKPTIFSVSSTISKEKNQESGEIEEVGRQISRQSIPNPKADLIPALDTQLKLLREQKDEKEKAIINARADLEKYMQERLGFLQELKILFKILSSSGIALSVWILLFVFFLSIELFVLASKIWDASNDYDKVIQHQLDTRTRIIDGLK